MGDAQNKLIKTKKSVYADFFVFKGENSGINCLRGVSVKKIGEQTFRMQIRPQIISYAAVVGEKEGSGRLGREFDLVEPDSYFGKDTWEAAESEMLRRCFERTCFKANLAEKDIDIVLSGDLLDQCTSSAFTFRKVNVPYIGLYAACSTMAESIALASMLIDGGFGENICAITSSHFCTAERQYRFPLEYGGQKPPTAQSTVTGAGGVIVSSKGKGASITYITAGKITDAGITDSNNMGSAMAPAALGTIVQHFKDTGRTPDYYDAIFTGDLGAIGHDILEELLLREGFDVIGKYHDCGVMIYDDDGKRERKFGSGCGCCASVLCGHILPEMKKGHLKKILFAATGALLSPTTVQQKESIPGICHAVAIESEV